MEIYSTEDQQVDAIKQFWKDYGTSIIIGAVVGLGGLFGWNYYSDHKVKQTETASEAFQALTAAGETEAQLLKGAENFSKNYRESGYQALIELMVAKAAVEKEDYDKAAAALKSIIASNPDKSLLMLASIRLARVQAQQEQYAAAIATLAQVDAPAFLAQRDELKGDIFVKQGEDEQAKTAYQSAIDEGGIATSPELQMKLDNLNKA